MRKWLNRILLGLGLLIFVVVLFAAFTPLPTDELLPEAQWGAGASSVLPAHSGLQREFPALNGATTPDTAELGRLLFYDPILSERKDTACATCHNPSLGFSDGKQVPDGLQRNSPSLWNVAYAANFFWDGRESSLEDQLLVPLHAPEEMAMTDEVIVARLQAIPAYVDLFDQAFGGGAAAVTIENMQAAIAAFERTLITRDSPFDRYAAGQFAALTAGQRRGLDLFRSAATRCFECHAAPTFGGEGFFVTGVPEYDNQAHDAGRAAVASDAPDGAFKAPTLRNIALSAPYMHNGVFATLDEVIAFYAQGGGLAYGVPVDRQIVPFTLTAQEKQDLIAFLLALTDESALPQVPAAVPSGLPVVPMYPNPARDTAQAANVQPAGAAVAAHEPVVIRVGPNETLQGAIDRSRPGDTIMVPFGTYYETLILDWSDVRLLGIPNEHGDWPVLDGEGVRADGVIASGNNFEMAYFTVRNYTANGVLVEGVTGVYLHDLYVENAGIYGVYPVRSSDVLLERIEATGMNDAGIYAGKSADVVIRDNVVYGNVTGIEVENCVNVEIADNDVYDNAMGISVFLLPNLPSKVSLNTAIHGNRVENNNGANFAPENSIQAAVPPGSGILILAADQVDVFANTIRGNRTGGVGVFSLDMLFDPDTIDVGPNPEQNTIHDNIIEHNGYDAAPFIKNLLGQGYDIIWDGSGAGNAFNQPGASSFPPALPGSGWPEPVYNLYWRLLNWAAKLVG